VPQAVLRTLSGNHKPPPPPPLPLAGTPTHGYEPTREAAMAAFAKSWQRSGCLPMSDKRLWPLALHRLRAFDFAAKTQRDPDRTLNYGVYH
jgi:hypothetical protein